nr:apical endosomal glycoprotein [Pogona vitticeps]
MSGSRLLGGLMLLEVLTAGPLFFVQAAFVNRCGSVRTSLCDFVCDCWDCSDENQCGYQKESVPLGTQFTCDFEGTSCGWEDVSTTAFRWTPARASISTWGTKPPFDHTLGTDQGWYMSTTSQTVKPSATAKLTSPTMREAAATCEIRASYHLSGLSATDPPALTLELSYGNTTITLWRSPPSSTYPWRELVAYTGRILGTFQVTFSATQTYPQRVQLALDDVEFRNCGRPRAQACTPEEHQCQRGGCVALDRLCDGTEDCWDGEDERGANCTSFSSCPFESSWCGWEALPHQSLTWTRHSSLLVSSSLVGPTRDHSTNSQEGIFVSISNPRLGLPGGRAWLASPSLKASKGALCHLVLYLHLHGSGANSLNIYSRTEGTMELVRSRSGDLGNYWFREKVDFHVAETFQIILEGVIAAGHEGNVALDDLILSPGCVVQSSNISLTPDPDPPSSCSQEEFACRNGTGCLGSELVCNFKAECADASDEADCGATAFGTGGWTDLSVGRMQWTVQNASGWLNSAGISLHLQEGPGQMLSLARAATPVLGPSGLACALEMNFTAGPQGFLALAVADESLGTGRWVWYALGNATTGWSHARIPLGARARPFQLELLGSEDRNSPGGSPLLTIRHIAFVDCDASAALPESSGLSCNFETGWCGWFVEQSGGFEWERSQGPGWEQDHTTGTGFFLLADPSAPGADGLSARLVSAPQAAAGNDSCLSFWYRLDGPQIGTLNLLVKSAGGPAHVLWTRTGSQGAVWRHAFSTVSHQAGQNFQVIFEALRNGFLGSVALDDISVVPGACSAQIECSFETDECGLVFGGQQAWVRQNGTGGWGPLADHTLGTPQGHYLVLNTSGDTSASSQRATLRSGVFPPWPRTHCVTFWYYLSSGNPGSLRAYVEEGGRQKEVLTKSLVPGEAWHFVSFGTQIQRDWQVTLLAERGGGGPASYLALDDLYVQEGACSEPGSCDFEWSTCGWSKPPGDWYSWDRKEGATPSQSPSPKEDHTLGNKAGHYIYVDIALLGLGRSAARLTSEPLPSTTGSCLRFHYHMDFLGQSSQAELRVKLSSLQGERTLWSAVGHQSRTWKNQSLLVSSLTEFQIVLEATSGAWPSSETIAVDDISYVAGLCSVGMEESQEAGSSSRNTDSEAGLVAGVVCSVLLVVAAALIVGCCLKKQRVLGERQPAEHASAHGFDNIAFRDDVVIINSISAGLETE